MNYSVSPLALGHSRSMPAIQKPFIARSSPCPSVSELDEDAQWFTSDKTIRQPYNESSPLLKAMPDVSDDLVKMIRLPSNRSSTGSPDMSFPKQQKRRQTLSSPIAQDHAVDSPSRSYSDLYYLRHSPQHYASSPVLPSGLRGRKVPLGWETCD